MKAPETPPFKESQPIDIVVSGASEPADNETIYFSRILSVKKDVLLIAPPVLDGIVLSSPLEPLKVRCRLPAGLWVWAFNGLIPSILGDTWVLQKPPESEVIREPHRGNIRASVTLEVQAALHMANQYFPEMTLRILDIGSTGCQLAGERPFIPHSVMRLRIPLGGQTLEVHGKIVRTNPFPQGIHQHYYVSDFQFSNLSPVNRDALLAFILEHLAENDQNKK
ncbi:MAG: PilZ domain-containing protein [Candidatus Sericytochromatia bacterium]|nr:PilZ domain-containing protein [Candidatus Sericytochromatia bacterium]